jgi:hypothetical protein
MNNKLTDGNTFPDDQATNAGLIAPTVGLLNPNSTTKIFYNGFGPLIKYKVSDLTVAATPMHRFSFANNANYGDALVIIPQPRNCSQYSSIYGNNPQTSQTIYWVVVPMITSRTNAKSNFRLRLMPMQHFHPFLLWRFAPIPFGTVDTGEPRASDCTNCNSSYWSGNLYGVQNTPSIKTRNAHFMMLMHYSSLSFLETSNCCSYNSSSPAKMSPLTTINAGYGTGNGDYDATKFTAFMLRGKNFIRCYNSKSGLYEGCLSNTVNYTFDNLFRYGPNSNASGIEADPSNATNLMTINMPYQGSGCGSNSGDPGYLNCNIPDTEGFKEGRDLSRCVFDDNCNSYFTIPMSFFQNSLGTNPFMNYLSVNETSTTPAYNNAGSVIQIENLKGMTDYNGPTRFMMLSISANNGTFSDDTHASDPNNFFTKYADSPITDLSKPNNEFNRSGVTVPFVRYPTDISSPFSEDPSLNFIAPIQYALLALTPIDTYVQLYDWDLTFSNWYMIGIVSHDITAIVSNPAPAPLTSTIVSTGSCQSDLDSCYKWIFTGNSFTGNIYTPCTGKAQTNDQPLLDNYPYWTTTISFQDSSKNMWYLYCDFSSTNKIVDGIYKLGFAIKTSVPLLVSTYNFYVSPNGYIFMNNNGVKNTFLGTYTDPQTKNKCLVWVNITEVAETTDFSIPMVSFLFDLNK